MKTASKTITRRGDPHTSRLAAEPITANGKRLSQTRRIVACLKEHPGATVWDIGQATGIPYFRVAKRMGDVRMLGFEPGDAVYVAATASMMQTWWPEPDDRQLRMF